MTIWLFSLALWFDKMTTGGPDYVRLELENVKISTENEKITLLKQYKELLDYGIITQEDFDEKKEKLLSQKVRKKLLNVVF